MKGFSTKYALTNGIREVEVSYGTGGYVYTADRYSTQLVPGKTFFKTRKEAELVAQRRATEKIASLEKQIEKLHQLALFPKWAR